MNVLSHPRPLARSKQGLPCACGGLLCLILFSIVNISQQNAIVAFVWRRAALHHANPFSLDMFLLAGFFGLGYLALSSEVSQRKPVPADAAAPVTHDDPLLTLRLFACLMVLVGHGVGFTCRATDLISAIQSGSLAWLLTSAPEAGVWIFFTLSGYLIGKGFFAGRYDSSLQSVRMFYRNRILRIIPVYWFTLTVFSVWRYPAIFLPNNLPAFLNMLFFNFDGRLPFMPIGALWSISTEMQFYMAAPLLFIIMDYCAGRKYLFSTVLLITFVAPLLARVMVFRAAGYDGWLHLGYPPLVMNLDLFVAGMTTSLLILKFRAAGQVLRHGLLCGIAALSGIYVVTTYLRAHATLVVSPGAQQGFAEFAPSITAGLTAFTLICFELAPKLRPDSWSYRLARPIQRLGMLTYAIYSVHEPVLLTLRAALPPKTIHASLLRFGMELVIICLLAGLVYWLVELPFDRRKASHGMSDSLPVLS